MEKEEIEGNKLIFDFMGCVHSNDAAFDLWEMNTLKYDKSWDQLMPVVEKCKSFVIEKLDRDATNYKIQLHCLFTGITVALISTDGIKSVWLAVLDFIHYYNNQGN